MSLILRTVADTVTVALSAVAFQNRATLGTDFLVPFSLLSSKPISKVWTELMPFEGGIYAGWNYDVTLDDNYSAMRWGGFDWGLTIIKRF